MVQGEVYTDAGATAEDDVDGDVTGNIVTVGLPIDTLTLGDHMIHYSVSDKAGNTSAEVTRTVSVVAPPEEFLAQQPSDTTSSDPAGDIPTP